MLLAAMPAVLAAGCSASHVPQNPQTGVMATPRSVSPALLKAPPMAGTAVMPSRAMTSQTVREPMGTVGALSYTQLPGAATYAAAAQDGSLWVLSTLPSGSADKYIWHYANGTWTNVSGLASKIAVAPNGALLAINSSGGAYSYYNGAWSTLGGGCREITVGGDGTLYVISNAGGADGAIWEYGKNGVDQWTQLPGAGNAIAASWDTQSYTLANGTITPGGFYVINSRGSIYYFNGTSYVPFDGAASAIAPIGGGLFVIGYSASTNGGALYYDDLTHPAWTAENGAGTDLSSDGRSLYVISASGGIYEAPLPITAAAITEFPITTASAQPEGLTVGPDGNIWFTELFGNKIANITTGGKITEFALPANPSYPNYIVTGPDNNLWFSEGYVNAIAQSTTAGAVTSFPVKTPNAAVEGVVVGSDGNLWFGEVNANQIGKMTMGGAVTEYPLPTPNAEPDCLAAGPDGNVWFAEFAANKIGKITTAGAITEYPIPTSGANPACIAAGGDGNMWFTENGANKIGKITTSGAFTEYPLPASNSGPEGIAQGPSGDLWFTEVQGNKIGEITTTGVITESAIPTASSVPVRIVKGPDGNMWFTESAASKIGKVTL